MVIAFLVTSASLHLKREGCRAYRFVLLKTVRAYFACAGAFDLRNCLNASPLWLGAVKRITACDWTLFCNALGPSARLCIRRPRA